MAHLAARALFLSGLTAIGACDLVGPSCLERRETGHAASVTGAVGRGEIVAHRIPYDTRGSQNDVRLTWTGQADPGGPRLRFYATRTDCAGFQPPPAAADPACASLAGAGVIDGIVINELHVTHGRGNPERLGTPPEFLLGVVGDPDREAAFTADVTWLFGPDC